MRVEDRFEAVIKTLRRDPRVTEAKMFGARGLGIGGKYFAMLYKGQLVVKLPNDRIQALVAARDAAFFDPGMGRLMKEWAVVPPEARVDWLGLAREAQAFVAAGGRETGPRKAAAGMPSRRSRSSRRQ